MSELACTSRPLSRFKRFRGGEVESPVPSFRIHTRTRTRARAQRHRRTHERSRTPKPHPPVGLERCGITQGWGLTLLCRRRRPEKGRTCSTPVDSGVWPVEPGSRGSIPSAAPWPPGDPRAGASPSSPSGTTARTRNSDGREAPRSWAPAPNGGVRILGAPALSNPFPVWDKPEVLHEATSVFPSGENEPQDVGSLDRDGDGEGVVSEGRFRVCRPLSPRG